MTKENADLPICSCAEVWPGSGHHPHCPVRLEIERLRAEAERVEALRNADEWPMCERDAKLMEDAVAKIDRLAEDRDFWKAEAARWQETAHKVEAEWATLSQDDGKVERALERSEEENRRLRSVAIAAAEAIEMDGWQLDTSTSKEERFMPTDLREAAEALRTAASIQSAHEPTPYLAGEREK